MSVAGLLRIDEPGARHAVARRDTELAPVVLPALLRAGQLQRADRVEARVAVVVERRHELDGLERQPGHRPRVARGEHATGRVRGGAAGGRDGPLVDDDDIAPAALDQVVRRAGARRCRHR